jgi:hypothetical protein
MRGTKGVWGGKEGEDELTGREVRLKSCLDVVRRSCCRVNLGLVADLEALEETTRREKKLMKEEERKL